MNEFKAIQTWWLRGMIQQMKDWQEKAKASHDAAQANDIALESQTLYSSWLNATDDKIKQQCLSSANCNNISLAIKQAATDHWSTAYEWLWVDESISRYIEKNPQFADITNQAINGKVSLDDWASSVWAYIDNWVSDTDLYESYVPMNTWKDEQEWAWVGANILWWVMETIYWIPKTLNKWWNYLAYGIDRLRWTDKERAKEVLEYNQKRIDNMYEKITPWDEDSKVRQWVALWTAFAATILSSFIPWLWEAKWAELLTKYPKLAALAKNSPKLMKMLKWWWEWVKDTVLFNTLQWELTSPTEAGAWWLLNVAFWKWGELVRPLLNKMWIKGLMTTWKAKKVIETIREEWWKAEWVDALANWFNTKWWKWNSEQIMEQVKNYIRNTKWLKDELLSLSDEIIESPETTKILSALREKFNVPWLEEKLSKVDELLGKWWKYTLSDMEETLRLLDDSSLNPFQRDQFWKLLKSESSEWMANLRTRVKELIENKADELWLGDIRWLNNEIVTSNKFYDGVMNKTISEQLKDWLAQYGLPSTVWGIFWYIKDWDIAWALKYWAGLAIGRKLLKSTAVRTYLSSAIQKLEWTERVTLEKWLGSEWKQKLTEKGSQILANILENADEWIRQDIVDIFLETAREWTVIWWAEWVDALLWE